MIASCAAISAPAAIATERQSAAMRKGVRAAAASVV
jgi:hypothetical protein